MKGKYIGPISIIAVVAVMLGSITLSPSLKKQVDKAVAYIGEHDNVFLMYQNMANPFVRYVRIPEGLRKEEVALIYKKNLGWDNDQILAFLNESPGTKTVNLEGHYFPATYVLAANADGASVKDAMITKFNNNLFGKEGNKSKINKDVINVDTALTIASLIQREAGRTDMNLISGIIWNRIWNGMSLDIDATLQYAKGTSQNGWWPQVHSADKKIDSPYNTYLNAGLPPSPISNPGPAAIEAAYNPTPTSCLFYFHDNNHQIHCSKTYAEHAALVNQYLR